MSTPLQVAREALEALVRENDTDEWLEEDSWGYDYGTKPDEAYRGGASDEANRVSQKARAVLARMDELAGEGDRPLAIAVLAFAKVFGRDRSIEQIQREPWGSSFFSMLEIAKGSPLSTAPVDMVATAGEGERTTPAEVREMYRENARKWLEQGGTDG